MSFNQIMIKEILWGLSMMAMIFGFGFHMDESMFAQTEDSEGKPDKN